MRTHAQNGLLVWALAAASLAWPASAQVKCSVPPFPAETWGVPERSLVTAETQLLASSWRTRLSIAVPNDQSMCQELRALRALAALRPERQAAITRQQLDLDEDYQAVLGIRYAERPAVAALIHAVAIDVAIVVMRLKADHARGRPWQVDPQLGTAIERPAHPSYPSGHAAQAFAISAALRRVVPHCQRRLSDLAASAAFNREVAGVHFRSDTTAGRDVARQIIRLMTAAPKFQDLVRAAREEVAQSRALCCTRTTDCAAP
jgi:membrane-associated phospholipid phosphatase